MNQLSEQELVEAHNQANINSTMLHGNNPKSIADRNSYNNGFIDGAHFIKAKEHLKNEKLLTGLHDVYSILESSTLDPELFAVISIKLCAIKNNVQSILLTA